MVGPLLLYSCPERRDAVETEGMVLYSSFTVALRGRMLISLSDLTIYRSVFGIISGERETKRQREAHTQWKEEREKERENSLCPGLYLGEKV